MPLPANFHDFIEPRDLEQMPVAGVAAYTARFYLRGFRLAAMHLKIYSPNELQRFIEGRHDRNRSAATDQVPSEWLELVPDLNAAGHFKEHNTYWKHYPLSQMQAAWAEDPQTLPKALLGIAALYAA